jgi:uncharacterized repeat protein (TIGR03806 family)
MRDLRIPTLFCLLLSACGDDVPTPTPLDVSDAAEDLVEDTATESAVDVTTDTSPDAAVDVTPDATVDTAPDITADAMIEATVDVPSPMDVTDRPDVIAPADVTDRPDVIAPTDVTDRPDVIAPTDVTDRPDVVDVAPTWGLDTRPRNATCVAFARPTSGTGVALTRVFPSLPNLSGIVGLIQPPADRTRWFEITLGGRVLSFSNTDTVSTRTTVMDITSRVLSGGELGLLGMAFHPSFATNGQVFLSYTARPRAGVSEAAVSRLSRFRSMDGGATIDPASEQILMEISQPYSNHNGGWIEFGRDGFLYYGLGDGGSAGDPLRSGQDLNSLLGKMLRIDVNTTSTGRMYGIPSDNPFAGGTGGRPEVYAWGLRNPWRWSFDRATGDLWAGDVGQNQYEEVDIIRRGGNYGWNVMEGLHCYGSATCNQAGLTLPVVEYDHSLGVSITGGYVYRGSRVPWLVGSYLFGDYQSGRVWRVAYSTTGVASRQELANAGFNFGTFGQDLAGEVYIVSLSDGRIVRVDPGPMMPVDTVPPNIRATGCVDTTNPLNPAVGLIPYAPNAPFWSDGAEKERFLALPDGARITINADGDWDLPVGSVLVKNFTYMSRRIETRLFVRHADGEWAGYTYRWNDAQTDATVLPASDTRPLPGGAQWYYPSRAQCMECHTAAAGRSLGLETAQLNGSITYGATGRTANQLTTLDHLGMFTTPLSTPVAMLPRLVSPTGTDPIEARVRSYLHTNCSMCHRPGATGRGTADFRYSTALPMLGVCNTVPTAGDLGVTGARLVLPGDPARSLVSVRTRATNAWRMPPISSNVVDTVGTTLLDDWIRSLRACP